MAGERYGGLKWLISVRIIKSSKSLSFFSRSLHFFFSLAENKIPEFDYLNFLQYSNWSGP